MAEKKLRRSEFDSTYRFREYRGHDGARCEECVHQADGRCSHPGRRTSVKLTRTFPSSLDHRERYSLCDAIEIPFPPDFTSPELPEGHVFEFWGQTGWSPYHGDPHCPYLAAAIVKRPDGKVKLRVVDLSGRKNTGLTDQCELPACRSKIGLPPGRPDLYLGRLGVDDGYIYIPPPPIPMIPNENDGSAPTLQAGPYLPTELLPFTDGKWPEQTITWGVWRIKRLMETPWMQDTPDTGAVCGHSGVSTLQLHIILEALGWGPVALRLAFEKDHANEVVLLDAQKPYRNTKSLFWSEETTALATCVLRGLTQMPELNYKAAGGRWSGHNGVDWFHWQLILHTLDRDKWGDVTDRIEFRRAIRQGDTYCVRCGLAMPEITYNFNTPENPPKRSGSRPCCPNCNSPLTCWSNFISQMPE